MSSIERTDLAIITPEATLDGDLWLPPGAPGIVLFAHGSGSSRLSPRNRYVAGEIVDGGLGTLLFDLLTAAEERRDRLDASLRFDIGLLSRRLADATLAASASLGRILQPRLLRCQHRCRRRARSEPRVPGECDRVARRPP